MLRSLVPAVFLLVGYGCSSEERGAEPCNTVPNNGPKVMVIASDAPTPTPMGGEIANGTYVLVGISYYGDAASLPSREFQSAFEISGDTMQQVGSIDDEETRYTSTFTTSGTTITTRDTCPSTLRSVFQYTAMDDVIFLYDERAGDLMEQRFELRE